MDVAICVAAAPVVLTICLIAALAILITSGRPIFFVQERVGLRGKRFKIFKLRTMRNTTAEYTPTSVADDRVTRIGRPLRKYRIDELPQFLNILAGDMSLVGPRPDSVPLYEKFSVELPRYHERHRVRPGLTGLAQVRYGYAGSVAENAIKNRYDRCYVRNCSFWLDVYILMLTIGVVLKGHGAR